MTARLEEAFDPFLSLPVAGKRNCVAFGLTAPVPSPAILAQRMVHGSTAWSLPLGRVLSDLQRRHGSLFRC